MSLAKSSLVVVVLTLLSGCTIGTVTASSRGIDSAAGGMGPSGLGAAREPNSASAVEHTVERAVEPREAPPAREPIVTQDAPCWRCD